ncbi:hypothetical protein CHS0354_032119 [Potamilus streckersoni]|uniref:TIR domain-containing protein n=1 Tax=Potamilus streckersoni TaxID=2493646 RepID=A0AAE0VVJ7_9BIVA|nr:hypothetical protein CHS0354_032119 [Potamilus streckersoni]
MGDHIYLNFFDGMEKSTLREIQLRDNSFQKINDRALQIFRHLAHLDFSNNNIVLGRLDDLFLNEMKLTKIASFAFNNSNLKLLSLTKCNIKFTSDNFDYANLFRWSPNLQRLQLDSNNMYEMNASSLMSMLSPLKKLKDLNLESTKLKTLSAEIFKPLVSLRHLDLTLNSISGWPITLFSNVSKLSRLLMASNKIRVIKEGYLPSSLMEYLISLDLSENPFDCSCENLWFRKWMDNMILKKPDIFSNYPNHYRCATPSRLQGTLLMNYNPTDEDCRPWGHVLMDIIITSSAVCFIFACAAVVYIQRWNIRYLLHTIYMRRKKYTLLRDIDFQYDIYVAYSDKDASWVRNELWRELGQERGFKLYIRDKYEDPGVAKCDSIINNMYDSRKVLLVISSSFMSCPWCLYQLQVAQGRAVHTGPNWMIPVILGDLQIRHVTKSIRVLLTQENAITWSEEENGKRLFWSTILRSIETSVNLNDVIDDNSQIEI